MLNNTYQTEQLRVGQEQNEPHHDQQAAHPVVVIVDNDQTVLDLMEELLHAEGYTIHSFSGYDVQRASIQQICPDLVILEAHPRYASAPLAMIRQLRGTAGLRTTPIIINSTDRQLLESIMASLDHLSCYTFEKPFDIDFFLQFVQSVIGSAQEKAHEHACLYELGTER